MVTGDMRFDRSASDALLTMLQEGVGHALVRRAQNQKSAPLYDLQLRRAARGNETWATLYYGMTALINLRELRGKFRLTADKSYMAFDEFDVEWTTWRHGADLEEAWPRVERYIEAIAAAAAQGPALKKEGPVHAALASGNSDAFRIIQREAQPSFRDTKVKEARLAAWVAPFNDALLSRSDGSGWWPKDVRVGSSLDFLAVDIGGRLALIEAKAANASASEVAKVAVQAGVYAAMFAEFLREEGATALGAMATMLEQRARLGLSAGGVLHLREEGQVVPVIAVGPGGPSKEVHRRMWAVARAVDIVRDERVDPVEVWYLDRDGRIARVERAADVG